MRSDQLAAGELGVAQPAEVEGVVREAVFAPEGHLLDELFVPRAQDKTLALDLGRVQSAAS